MSSNMKSNMFEKLAQVGKGFNNETRLELILLLAQGKKSVDVLAKEINRSIASTSQHLQVLRKSGLVRSKKVSQFVICELTCDISVKILMLLRKLAIAEIKDFENNDDYSDDDFILLNDLQSKQSESKTLMIDVRPESEFVTKHIEKAINIPFDELEQRFKELPKNKKIVTYSRGFYCDLSRKSAESLKDKGYEVKQLKEGFACWQVNGNNANNNQLSS